MTFSKIRLLPGLLVLVFSTGLCAQIDWLDYYNEAMQAISESDWESADQNLGEALKLKRKATFEAETYALQVITYTPYYWRGIVYFNLGRYEESVSYLTQSENWGAIKKTPQYETLKATRERARAILGLQRRADSL
ncbi:MAG TPA: hypothetical protein PKV71_14330, partial [Calditrichia bacterium]|nr:hypothetical protein [Calditrichia bacterium]